MNNNQNNGCGCNCNPKPENIDTQMDVCDRNINMLPMLQTYTTKVLQPNLEGCCKKNVLTQEMLSCENYKYVIKWDFDLCGKTITVPDNCILEFDGGSLKNGTIVGNNTGIKAGLVRVFHDDITLAGTWNVAVSYPEWFDVSDAATTRNAIQKAVVIANHIILKGQYDVQNTVYNGSGDMYAQRQLILNGEITEDYITVGSDKLIEVTGKVKATSPLTDLFRVEGNNTMFFGGGTIEGCGVVNDYNDGSGVDRWKQWEASLIRIVGNDNIINGVNLYQPTTNCVYIKGDESSNNIVENCVIGGGLESHGSGTKLFGVHAEGLNTKVSHNDFVAVNNKNIYTAIYSTGNNDLLGTSFIFEGNHVDGMLEHAVYSYSKNVVIKDNYITNCDNNYIQVMNEVTLIENNRLVVTAEQLSGEELKNYTGIFAQRGNHCIKNNKFFNFTDLNIHISDGYMASIDGLKNISITDNYIELYHGYVRGPFGISIYSEASDIEDVRIENNIITCKNLGAIPDKHNCSHIRIHIDNDSCVGKNILICKNSISNSARTALQLLCSDADFSQGRVVFTDVTISENNIIDGCRSSYSYSNWESSIELNNVDRVNLSGNHVSYTQEGSIIDGDVIPFCRAFNLLNCHDYLVEHNICSHYIKEGEGRAYKFFGFHNCSHGNVLDNDFDGLQEGVFTIVNGNDQVDDRYVALNYFDHDYDYNIAIQPLNAAAIELQNSENYVVYEVWEYPTAGGNYIRMLRFKTNTNAAVPADCKFAFKIMY